MKYNIKTSIDYANDNIILETEQKFQGVRELLMREIIKTKEQSTRDALIKLGWTPPGPTATGGEVKE